MKTYTQDLPAFESIGEHEQLGLGVRRGADGREREPGVADFTCIGLGATVARVTGWPGPELDIPETSGTDNFTIANIDDDEGKRRACVAPSQRRFNIRRGLAAASRNGAPLVKRRIRSGSFCESIGVVGSEGFKPDVGAGKDESVFHSLSMRRGQRGTYLQVVQLIRKSLT